MTNINMQATIKYIQQVQSETGLEFKNL